MNRCTSECQYAVDWTEIKYRWDLTMTEREWEAVMEMLGTCENPPEVEVLDMSGASSPSEEWLAG